MSNGERIITVVGREERVGVVDFELADLEEAAGVTLAELDGDENELVALALDGMGAASWELEARVFDAMQSEGVHYERVGGAHE